MNKEIDKLVGKEASATLLSDKEYRQMVLDKISQAGARGDLFQADKLALFMIRMSEIPHLPEQDEVCNSLLRRLAHSQNIGRRQALVMALAFTKPTDPEVKKKVFGKATWLAQHDSHKEIAVWAGMIVAKFLSDKDKYSRSREVLRFLQRRLEEDEWFT